MARFWHGIVQVKRASSVRLAYKERKSARGRREERLTATDEAITAMRTGMENCMMAKARARMSEFWSECWNAS